MNFFDAEISIEYSYKKRGTSFPASQYCFLKCKDFFEIDNLNYENLVNDFKNIELSDSMVNHANNVLLEMIKAFDICNEDDLYTVILSFAEWLVGINEDYISKTISEINKLQIIKRKRLLPFEEKEILYSIVHKNENMQDCIASLLLLNEKHEANECFKILSEVEQKQFKGFPIAKFFAATN